MYAIAHVISLIIKPFIDIRDSYREERKIQADIERLYADHVAEHGERTALPINEDVEEFHPDPPPSGYPDLSHVV